VQKKVPEPAVTDLELRTIVVVLPSAEELLARAPAGELDQLDLEGDVRASAVDAFVDVGDAASALELVGRAWRFWLSRGELEEGSAAAAAALHAPGAAAVPIGRPSRPGRPLLPAPDQRASEDVGGGCRRGGRWGSLSGSPLWPMNSLTVRQLGRARASAVASSARFRASSSEVAPRSKLVT
jgi:hypothetical protein